MQDGGERKLRIRVEDSDGFQIEAVLVGCDVQFTGSLADGETDTAPSWLAD